MGCKALVHCIFIPISYFAKKFAIDKKTINKIGRIVPFKKINRSGMNPAEAIGYSFKKISLSDVFFIVI